MPPSMPNPSKRMTANPARPVARYRPGKAVHEEESSDEDEQVSEEEVIPQPQKQSTRPQQAIPKKPGQSAQRDDDDDEDGFVTDEEDEPHVPSEQRPEEPSTVPQSTSDASEAILQPSRTKPQSSEDEDESSDEESSEEESSSEDEGPRRKFQRPTFIKKSARTQVTGTLSANSTANTSTSTGNNSMPAVATSAVDEDEQLRRRTQADLMIQDKLQKDALARAAGKKSWDDDDDLLPEQLVDDTDGLDPEAEYQAWKLRELQRLKRDREAIEAREREIEEVERRRNLTAEERDREDAEFIAKQKEEREEGRSKTGFLARYHHKGAFFQDDEAAEILKKRDIMGAKFADEVGDKSSLPEYMRIRDMTKLGKKGRTRYTDLKGQDTGRFGAEVKRWRGAGDNRGTADGFDSSTMDVDERFMPDRDIPRYGDDRARRRSRSRSPRRREGSRDRKDSYRPRRRSYSRSRSRSRSRTSTRRKRSPSPYSDKEKRRKLEV